MRVRLENRSHNWLWIRTEPAAASPSIVGSTIRSRDIQVPRDAPARADDARRPARSIPCKPRRPRHGAARGAGAIPDDSDIDPNEALGLHAFGERIWLATEMACDPVWDLHEGRLGMGSPLQTVGGLLALHGEAFGSEAQAAALSIAQAIGDETVQRLERRLVQARWARVTLQAPRCTFLRSLVTLAASRAEGAPGPA